jgi:hypothetical protein
MPPWTAYIEPLLLMMEGGGRHVEDLREIQDDVALRTLVGLEQMSSGDFAANILWFSIGVLAYNLTQAEKLLFLDSDWRPRTIGTLRWQLIGVAGRLVRHGRR